MNTVYSSIEFGVDTAESELRKHPTKSVYVVRAEHCRLGSHMFLQTGAVKLPFTTAQCRGNHGATYLVVSGPLYKFYAKS